MPKRLMKQRGDETYAEFLERCMYAIVEYGEDVLDIRDENNDSMGPSVIANDFVNEHNIDGEEVFDDEDEDGNRA